MRRYSLLVVACALLASCTTTPDPFPELDQSRLADAIAVVRFGSATYLKQFPVCDEPDVICMDPPPFKLQAEVVEQVYGQRLPRRFLFASTSHYGVPRTSIDTLQMIHLISDGSAYVMPRYHHTEVGENIRGDLMLPARPDEVWWLPCGINSIKTEASFQFPRNGFAKPAEDFDQKLLTEHPEFYVFTGKNVRPRYGIRIDDLARFLKERQPTGEDSFACNDEQNYGTRTK